LDSFQQLLPTFFLNLRKSLIDMILGKDYSVPAGLERCRPLVDRLYRQSPETIKLTKRDRLALTEFGVLFDRDNRAELGRLAGAAGLSMADLNRLTTYLIFQRFHP
jgi:hypothetical protein